MPSGSAAGSAVGSGPYVGGRSPTYGTGGSTGARRGDGCGAAWDEVPWDGGAGDGGAGGAGGAEDG
jgi:hypothetical protein